MLWSGLVGVIVDVLNRVIVALADAVEAGFGALPDMPTLPTPPASFTMAEGWVAWVFPVGTVLDILGFCTTAWALWFLASIALRWAKAERGAG